MQKLNNVKLTIIFTYCSDCNSNNRFIKEQDVKGLLDSLGVTTF